MKRIFGLFCAAGFSLVIFMAFQNLTTALAPAVANVNINKWIATRSPSFFGINTLNFIDTDAAFSRASINPSGSGSLLLDQYKELGVTRLRFPGGEISDNYNWEKNRLDDPMGFPREFVAVRDPVSGQTTLQPLTEAQLDNRMDTLEFCERKKRLGANVDAAFVVNVAGAFADPQVWRDPKLKEQKIQEYIGRARRWVRYVNIYHSYKCGKILEWELGNEVYFGEFTAREYAGLVNRFSKAMKSIDPAIRVGAVGPWSSAGQDYGFADLLLDSALSDLRDNGPVSTRCKAIVPALTKPALAKCMNGGVVKPNPEKWWPVVSTLSKDQFDFAVVHKYDVRRTRNMVGPAVPLKNEVAEIRAMILAGMGHKVPLLLSEWNLGSASDDELSAVQHALSISEMMTAYLSAGVEGANYWPARLPGHDFTLLKTRKDEAQIDAMEILSSGQIFRLFSKTVRWRIVEASTDDPSIDILASTDTERKAITLIITNRNPESRQIKFPAFNARVSAAGSSFVGSIELPAVLSEISIRELSPSGELSFELPASSVTKIEVRL